MLFKTIITLISMALIGLGFIELAYGQQQEEVKTENNLSLFNLIEDYNTCPMIIVNDFEIKVMGITAVGNTNVPSIDCNKVMGILLKNNFRITEISNDNFIKLEKTK